MELMQLSQAKHVQTPDMGTSCCKLCWTKATFGAEYKQRRCPRVDPDGSFHSAPKGDEGPREAARYESLISLSDSQDS